MISQTCSQVVSLFPFMILDFAVDKSSSHLETFDRTPLLETAVSEICQAA